MQVVKTEADKPFRLGLTASRKVGNAVVRNRARRRLREMVRIFDPARLNGFEIVLIAKTDAATRDFVLMQQDFSKGLVETKVTV